MSPNKDSNSSKKYKVIFDKEGCIGAAACVASDPNNWKLQDDGKSSLKDSTEIKDQFEREITEEEQASEELDQISSGKVHRVIWWFK